MSQLFFSLPAALAASKPCSSAPCPTVDAATALVQASHRSPKHHTRNGRRTGRHASSNPEGFTLIELVVVIGIIIIILGFAAPGVVGILKGKKVEQAVAVVSDVLERTRMESITKNTYIWVGFANVGKTTSPSGQDELWVGSFQGKNTENRIPTDSNRILPTSGVKRIEGVSFLPKESLTDSLKERYPANSKDFPAETPSKQPITWTSTSGGQTQQFDRLILFTPRGEALLETGDLSMPSADAYLWIGMSRTVGGKPAAKEKDMAAVLLSGLTGKVSTIRP